MILHIPIQWVARMQIYTVCVYSSTTCQRLIKPLDCCCIPWDTTYQQKQHTACLSHTTHELPLTQATTNKQITAHHQHASRIGSPSLVSNKTAVTCWLTAHRLPYTHTQSTGYCTHCSTSWHDHMHTMNIFTQKLDCCIYRSNTQAATSEWNRYPVWLPL